MNLGVVSSLRNTLLTNIHGWDVRNFLLLCLLAMVAGCSYKAVPLTTPALDVYSSYDNKIRGKYLLYVDASTLNETIKPTGLTCSAHKYPVDLTETLSSSIKQTLDNVVEEVEVVDSPQPASALAARGARGMIVIRGQDMRGRVIAIPGFWTSDMEARMEIVAGVTVDGRSGRLLGKTFEGSGEAMAPAGGACEGGAKAIQDATEQAVKDSLRQMAEALANSERVRAGG